MRRITDKRVDNFRYLNLIDMILAFDATKFATSLLKHPYQTMIIISAICATSVTRQMNLNTGFVKWERERKKDAFYTN